MILFYCSSVRSSASTYLFAGFKDVLGREDRTTSGLYEYGVKLSPKYKRILGVYLGMSGNIDRVGIITLENNYNALCGYLNTYIDIRYFQFDVLVLQRNNQHLRTTKSLLRKMFDKMLIEYPEMEIYRRIKEVWS